jgi:hypothetical protein
VRISIVLYRVLFGEESKNKGGNLISPQGEAGLMNRIELMIKYSPGAGCSKAG